MNWTIDVIAGVPLIPGHYLDSIQIFDSSINVTPALQNAEAEN